MFTDKSESLHQSSKTIHRSWAQAAFLIQLYHNSSPCSQHKRSWRSYTADASFLWQATSTYQYIVPCRHIHHSPSIQSVSSKIAFTDESNVPHFTTKDMHQYRSYEHELWEYMATENPHLCFTSTYQMCFSLRHGRITESQSPTERPKINTLNMPSSAFKKRIAPKQTHTSSNKLHSNPK